MARRFDARQRTMEEMIGTTQVTTVHMTELSNEPEALPMDTLELSTEPEALPMDSIEYDLKERFEIYGPYLIGQITRFYICNDAPCGQPMWPFVIAPRLTNARLALFGWMCAMEEEWMERDPPIRNVDESVVDCISRYEAMVGIRMEKLMNRVLTLPPNPTLKHYKSLVCAIN